MGAADEHAGERRYPPPGRAWWTVTVLTALYALSLLDRQIISLMIDDIRRDLQVSDAQIGLLQGLAFAAFYAVFGLAFGRAVDRSSRRGVIFVGVALWSVAAAACGLARSFGQLFAARVGVGAGEAALAPAAYSMISDSFPKSRLAFALSVFGVGSTIGGALSFALGGAVLRLLPAEGMVAPLLGHLSAWQLVFLLTGAPGLLLAFLIFMVVDPVSRREAAAEAGVGQAVAFLRSRRRFVLGHFFGFALMSVCAYGILSWEAMYFHRLFGWSLPKVALVLTGMNLVMALGGPFITGPLVDRWFRAGCKDAHLRLFIVCGLLQVVLVVAAVAVRDPVFSVCGFVAWGLVANCPGPAAAALQIVTPPALRGQVSAVYILVFNLMGAGFGGTIVGAFTSYLFKDDLKVGWSIALSFLIFMPIALALLASALRPMREAVAAAELAEAAG
jgi:MFS family permease